MSNPNWPPPRPLCKAQSWSPDMLREEVWQRRKGNNAAKRHRRGSQSVTDVDLEELKACIELGFGFEPDSPDLDPKLSGVLPALGFYCSVNKQYINSSSRSSSSSSIVSEGDGGGASSIFDPGEDPQTVKTRLRQWAQVVACSVKQSSSGVYQIDGKL